MTTLLQIDELRVEAAANARPLVDGVSLTLGRGEVLGLIGESGAGKTTIGLASLGYTRPGCRVAGGRVLFDGVDILRQPPAELERIRGRRIAYVSQSAAASFNPAWKLGRQVAEGPIRHGLLDRRSARDRSVELFKELDLPSPESFGERYAHQVSGGQLQRAMAAMAMSCRPEILVLDEPTTALDVTTQIDTLLALKMLIRNHRTAALYISHDLAVVAQIADRIMVLRHGRLVETGTTVEILDTPTQQYTRQLVSVRAADTTAPLPPPKPTGHGVPLLKLEGVGAAYRAKPDVLRDVTLEIARGETLAVVGESGSGKTSLARVICGLLPLARGTIQLAGARLSPSLARRRHDDLRLIQLVYQMPDVALNPHHRVDTILGRPVAFYRRERGADPTKVRELLEMVELPSSFASRRPGELSGGEKQRVCIARALAAEPELIICDEVTSALDPLVADGILKLLIRLQKENGLSYLFISHDLGAVRRVADRLAVMLQGEIVAQGPIAQVLSPPRHWYTDLLLSSVPEMRPGWLDGVSRRSIAAASRAAGDVRPPATPTG